MSIRQMQSPEVLQQRFRDARAQRFVAESLDDGRVRVMIRNADNVAVVVAATFEDALERAIELLVGGPHELELAEVA
jgi:hypothetical protein